MRISHCPPAPRRDDENAQRTVRPAALWVGLVVTLSLAAASCAHSIDRPSLLPGTWRVTVAAPSWAPPLGPGTPVGLVAGGDRSCISRVRTRSRTPRPSARASAVWGQRSNRWGMPCAHGAATRLKRPYCCRPLPWPSPRRSVKQEPRCSRRPRPRPWGVPRRSSHRRGRQCRRGRSSRTSSSHVRERRVGPGWCPSRRPRCSPSGAALPGAGSGPAAPETILVVSGSPDLPAQHRGDRGAESPAHRGADGADPAAAVGGRRRALRRLRRAMHRGGSAPSPRGARTTRRPSAPRCSVVSTSWRGRS